MGDKVSKAFTRLCKLLEFLMQQIKDPIILDKTANELKAIRKEFK